MRASKARAWAWTLTGMGLAACGGAQLNETKATDVQAAVLAAENTGANDQPKAALHLKLAKEQVEQAKRLAAEGEESESNLVLERAKVDAELAMQLARTEREQASAREAWEKIRALQQQPAR